VLRLALRQHRLADLHVRRRRLDADLVFVEVVAVGDHPGERDRVGLRQPGAETECFVGRQEITFAGRRGFLAEQRAQCAAAAFACCRQRDFRFPLLRRIAQPGIGTALQPQLERELLRTCTGDRERHRHLDFAAIDFLRAEVFVGVILALRPQRLADLHGRSGGDHAHLLLVEVVARLDVPGDDDAVALDARGVAIGALGRQEVVLRARHGTEQELRKQHDAHSPKSARHRHHSPFLWTPFRTQSR
jgi:hypothetical protein